MQSTDHVSAAGGLLPFRLLAPVDESATAFAAYGRDPLSYGELARQIESLRGVIAGAGIQPGGVVALAVRGGPEFITVFLAISTVGACAPLDPALTEPEFTAGLVRLGAQALVCEPGTAAFAAATALGIGVLTLCTLPGDPAGVCTLAPVEGSARGGRFADAALLLQTSATTGTPKLVPLTSANLEAMALHDSRALQLTSADRFLALMPLFHLHGISAALTQLAVGGAVMATPGFDAEEFVAWLAEFRPTWLSSTPVLHRALLALASRHPEAFRSAPLRLVRSTGAGLDPALLSTLEAATGVPVLEGYGLTETGGVARSTLQARRPGSVGRSSGLEIAILDASGARVPAGSEGEIAVRGPSVTSAYVDDPGATRLAFRDGWFHTGDLGHLDEDGFLFLSGRLKEVINRGGEKISPLEVDRVLADHPAVVEAASFAVSHRTLGDDVAAAVVLRAGTKVSERELRRFAATRLAAFKVPRQIAIVDSIPRGPTGKPKRQLLARETAAQLKPSEPAVDDPMSRTLTEIWQRVLGIGEPGAEDDFFALGGDSLSAAAMLQEVFHRFQVDSGSFFTLEFFEQPTIRSLALLIRAARAGSSGGACIALRGSGSLPPVFYIPASGQGPYFVRHLARDLGSERPFFVISPVRPATALIPIEDVAGSVVNTIRSIRQHGPYVLAGHCYGGVVAFDAARRIVLDGGAVAGLVLFDTATPGYPKMAKSWRRYAAYARTALSSLARGRLPLGASEAAAHLRALRRIVGRRVSARAARMAPVSDGRKLTSLDRQVLDGLAMRAYTPRELAAPILHFIAAVPPASTRLLDDPRYGWRDFTRRGFEAYPVAASHTSMLESSNTGPLARQLQTFLESAR